MDTPNEDATQPQDGTTSNPTPPSSATRRAVPYIGPDTHPSRLENHLSFAAQDARRIAKKLQSDEHLELTDLRAEMAELAQRLELVCRTSIALARSVQRADSTARSAAGRVRW